MTKWISVKERIPAPYEIVLIFLPEETMPIKICQFNDYDLMERLGITHWMKLPEEPSEMDE